MQGSTMDDFALGHWTVSEKQQWRKLTSAWVGKTTVKVAWICFGHVYIIQGLGS